MCRHDSTLGGQINDLSRRGYDRAPMNETAAQYQKQPYNQVSLLTRLSFGILFYTHVTLCVC